MFYINGSSFIIDDIYSCHLIVAYNYRSIACHHYSTPAYSLSYSVSSLFYLIPFYPIASRYNPISRLIIQLNVPTTCLFSFLIQKRVLFQAQFYRPLLSYLTPRHCLQQSQPKQWYHSHDKN